MTFFEVRGFTHEPYIISANNPNLEWLDESDESPSSDPAEVLVKALEEIAGYVAHNGDDWAKRTAETALLKHKNQANEVNNDTKNEG